MNIKKFLSIMIVFIISFVAIQPINNYSNLLAASAEETVSPTSVTDGLLKYYIYPDHAELRGKDGTVEGEIIIPKMINNVPVTQINNMAFAACSKITSVTIPDSVVSIGPNAFANCSKLVSVKIPSSVTEIGLEAFKGTQFLANLKRDNPLVIINNILIDGTNCSGDIEIPENVKIIGANAFYSCDKITSVIIPDGVIRIELSAFAGCKNLSSIEIPDSVINFGRSVFSGTPWLTKLFNDEPLAIINHILIAAKNDIDIIEIPNGVTKIGDGVFYQSKVKSVIIPDGVKSIGTSAFAGSDLISITLPESVTNIEQGAFQNCKDLKSITIKNKDCVIYDNNKTISSDYSIVNMSTGTTKGVFSGIIEGREGSTAQAYAQKCKYNFSALNEDFTDIIEDGLKYRRYNDHVEVIYAINPTKDLSISSNISGLPVTIIRNISSSLVEDIILPSTVEYIDDRAFYNCESLNSITITNKDCKIYDSGLTSRFLGTIYCYEGSTAHAYAEKYGYSYEVFEESFYDKIQDSVTYRIYSDHAKIIDCISGDVESELIIPETIDNVAVTDINNYAFYLCNKITSIKLPEKITNIGNHAFDNCANLNNVTLNNGLKHIGESAFTYCGKLTSIIIPDSVLNIDKFAFSYCFKLESIMIMNKNCDIYDSNDTIFSGKTIIFGKDENEMITYFSGTIYGYKDSTAKQYSIKYNKSFKELTDVTETITTSTTSTTSTSTMTTTTSTTTTKSAESEAIEWISKNCTYEKYSDRVEIVSCNNKDVTEGVIPSKIEGLPVTSIGNNAFYGCFKLASLTIPNSVISIGGGAFEGCSNLKSIIIPDSVTSIGSRSFRDCNSLMSITILNPDCKIEDYSSTICNGFDDISTFYFDGTIYGYEGSTAQVYAEKYGYSFEPIKSEPKYSLGDINNDGQINAVDASSILAYYAKVSTNKDGGFNEAQKLAADVDNDGQVNAVDASNILEYYAYVSTTKEDAKSLAEFLKK